MKILNSILFLLIIFVVGNSSTAQVINPNAGVSDATINRSCGTMPALQQRIANDPGYAAYYYEQLAAMEAGTNRSSVIDCDASNTITIPIAVHFDASFTCADPECLVDETIEAIDALNASFADNTSNQLVQDLNNACGANYPLSAVSTGTCINFCLGEPRGATFNDGIDPACDPAITIGQYCGGRNYTTDGCVGGAAPYWTGFLNVFVVDGAGSGLLGVADGIPGQGNADGVTVIGSVYGADGNGCVSGGPINTSGLFGGGATLAHEVGHYLGLRHIWGDDAGDCGNNGDFISDTPDQGDNSQNLFPCPTVGTDCTGLPQTCGSYDYYHNFMDYTSDNCLVMFTQEQAQVMNNTAFALFGSTTAVCDPDPLTELTTLCEQTTCTPDCVMVVEYESVCNPGEADYEVTVTIAGGTGPYNIEETAENDPSTVISSLDTGVSAGTYTYTFTAGSSVNIVVTDTGVADCFDGEFIFDPCAICGFELTVDYDNVSCAMGAVQITLIITDAEGIVWIDQDGNSTFDAGVDIDVTTGGTFTFPSDDLTLTFYDGGAQDCSKEYTILSGNYACDGVADGDPPLLVCAFNATADVDNFVCNGDGTATVSITVDNSIGNVTFNDPNVTGTAPAYEIIVPVGDGACGTTSIVVADDGSDVSLNSGVEILSPPSIAGQITNSGTNVVTDWGIDIATVIPCVSGVLRQPMDGTLPETDFCEPTPPAAPTAAQCSSIAGNIAVIDRGLCNFTDKVENAQACGAIAVVICNCAPNSANCNSTDPNEIINMSGVTINPVTIPTISLSYNQCLEIYAEMATGDVEMCIGAPGDTPCERTIEIDACAFICEPVDPVSIDITDPCTCNADENVDLDGDGINDLFYEVITITAPAGVADWNGVFTTGAPLDMDGNPFTGIITDNGDGTYTIAFYLAEGDTYSANFTSAAAGYDVSISGGGCEPCALVPTLSQWGLIVLCLLLMTYGALALTTIGRYTLTEKKA